LLIGRREIRQAFFGVVDVEVKVVVVGIPKTNKRITSLCVDGLAVL
jgi:hypothetical protein